MCSDRHKSERNHVWNQWNSTNDAVIKVIGVGGGGGNAVEHMGRERIEGVGILRGKYRCTSARKTAVGQTIQIGSGITKDWALVLIQKLPQCG